MSVPRLGRASLPPGRSSVPQCPVHHFTVITIILVATVVASSQLKDECRQDRANFASQIHTIGSIDDALWAITKPDWQVYKLTPCPANESLVHCMMVDSPVEVDTKWPKLAEAAKSAAQSTDLSFPVDNSVVMDSSQFKHTVLAMHGDSFKDAKYFGFDFGNNSQVSVLGTTVINDTPGLWISSDVKDKAYRLLDDNKQVDPVDLFKNEEFLYLAVTPTSKTSKYICNYANKVQFKNQSKCDPKMDGSVKKAVLYRKQFYFFTSDTVYIFSDQAETEPTKMLSVSLKDFFHCNEPTTSAPPSSTRNATNPRITTNSTHISTTAKSSCTTIIIILGVVVIVLIAILTLIAAFYCWYRTKAPKDGKSNGNAIPGSSSPNDSKVSVKVQAVSKGSLKQSQTKAKAVAPNNSLGKHMKGSSSK